MCYSKPLLDSQWKVPLSLLMSADCGLTKCTTVSEEASS